MLVQAVIGTLRTCLCEKRCSYGKVEVEGDLGGTKRHRECKVLNLLGLRAQHLLRYDRAAAQSTTEHSGPFTGSCIYSGKRIKIFN